MRGYPTSTVGGSKPQSLIHRVPYGLGPEFGSGRPQCRLIHVDQVLRHLVNIYVLPAAYTS
jgi:hypothetical protein